MDVALDDRGVGGKSGLGDQRRSKHRIVRSAGLVGALTLVSRVLGLVRDAVVAALFPRRLTDAFFVAFTIPNVLRRLLAEGALTIAFIPVFTEYRVRSEQEARRFVDSAFTSLVLLLLAVSAAGVLAAPWLVRLFAWGFSENPSKFALAVTLTRIMFPYIFFASLTALAMGVLNTSGHFAGPALAPALLNVGIIGSVLVLGPVLSHMAGVPLIDSLAIGVLVGGAAQIGLQIPIMARFGYRPRIRFDPNHPGVRKVARLMGPAVFGLALYQLNVLLARLLASFLASGAVTYLYYAQRLIEFPMGVFAVAVATAATPEYSAHLARGDKDRFKTTLADSLRLTMFIVIPSTAGLLAFGLPLTVAFFQRGRFDYGASLATYHALAAFTMGLWAGASVRQIVPAYYALDDSKTPVRAAGAGLLTYLVVGLSLMGPLGHVGLALAVSASSMVNIALLAYVLRRRMGRLGWRAVAISSLRAAGASLVMAAGLWWVARFGRWEQGLASGRNILVLLAGLMVAALLYFGTARLLGSPEPAELLASLKRRKKRRSE